MGYFMELEHVTKQYGTKEASVIALNDVSFQIEEGAQIAVTGSSGSGKSTLLHIMGMVDTPTDGTISYEGQNMEKKADKELAYFRNHEVGFVYQNFNLIPELTAEDNILLPLIIAKEECDKAYLQELAEALDIEKEMKRLPTQLSGGQQQRVAIARALIHQPRMLLCDEPTGNLDSHNGKEVMRLLQNIHDCYHTTMLIVTHDDAVAACMKDNIRLQDGKIVEINADNAV